MYEMVIMNEADILTDLKKFLWKIRIGLKRKNVLDVQRKLQLLENWEWLSPDKMLAFLQERLRSLLLHSFEHVPYYRQVLANAGVIDYSGKINMSCFGQIPLLNKNKIHAHFEDLKSDDLSTRKWYENYSGGSSGKPVRLIQDKDFSDWSTAIKILYDLWSGYSTPAAKVVLWGSERDLFVGRENIGIRIRRWLNNEVWLNAFRMSALQMEDYVRRINSSKPSQILAYAESIYELSRFIKEKQQRVHFPRAIMTSAGTLYPQMRETIERVFGTRVFDRYGSREVGDIACECDHHSGLHVCPFFNYVEILMPDGRPAGPGEIGEIVVTTLTNYAFPLIRYRIEDMGVWSKDSCGCGRNWPLLKEVVGRITDILVDDTGQRVDGRVFNTFLRRWPFILKYQVIQEDYHYIRVLIVPREQVIKPNRTYHQALEAITQKIRQVMGSACRAKYEFVDDIAPTASGKYRYIISRVKENIEN